MSYKRLFSPPQQSFFLFGPKGTGKTYWIKKNLPDAVCIDLLESETYIDLLARPSLIACTNVSKRRGIARGTDEKCERFLPIPRNRQFFTRIGFESHRNCTRSARASKGSGKLL